MTTANRSPEGFLDYISGTALEIFPVPIAIFTAIFNVICYIIKICLLPARFCIYIGNNFPILTFLILTSVLITFFIVRKVTRRLSNVNYVHYFLYTLVPYGLSIVYTGLGIVFPQVHTITRIGGALLHPIRWILGIVETVDSRAAPIRRTVEALAPPKEGARKRIVTRTDSRESRLEQQNNDRVTCCICMLREKSVLLRPCNHLCLCEPCLKAVLKKPHCPICRSPIQEYINVYM